MESWASGNQSSRGDQPWRNRVDRNASCPGEFARMKAGSSAGGISGLRPADGTDARGINWDGLMALSSERLDLFCIPSFVGLETNSLQRRATISPRRTAPRGRTIFGVASAPRDAFLGERTDGKLAVEDYSGRFESVRLMRSRASGGSSPADCSTSLAGSLRIASRMNRSWNP